MNYQYPWQVIPPREADGIDSSWTVVFLSLLRRPNRISHETKDLLTMKSSQVGERDRTAGWGHGRRVKKENNEDRKEKKNEKRKRERERERERERREQKNSKRQETRAEKRESSSPLDSEVSGGRNPACCQLVSLSAHARWHRGDRRSRMDSHTDASCRGRTHNATVPDAYCYNAQTHISYACEERDQLSEQVRFAALQPSLVAESRLSIQNDFTRIY